MQDLQRALLLTSPAQGPRGEAQRTSLTVTRCPNADPSLTCPQDVYRRPTRDRSLKTLPEMKPLLSIGLAGASWSSGYSIKPSDHVCSGFQPLPV